MTCIIALSQSTFIEGRQILDPILVANEAVEDYQTKKNKGWILKLDMEKAFNWVKWDFLEKILKIKMFDHKWIEWMMGCLKTQDTQFLTGLNGTP